jgi:hypothetical protein
MFNKFCINSESRSAKGWSLSNNRCYNSNTIFNGKFSGICFNLANTISVIGNSIKNTEIKYKFSKEGACHRF